MSCPDWHRLAHRANPDEPLPSDLRRHALDCDACRDKALAIDPTLVFQRMPQVEVSADDIASMKRAVSAMRRGHAIEQRVVEMTPRRHPGWLQPAALAAMLLLAVLMAPATLDPGETLAPIDGVTLAATPSTAAHGTADFAFADTSPVDEALIGEVDAHEVVQLDHDEFSLVLVLTDTLDGEDLNV